MSSNQLDSDDLDNDHLIDKAVSQVNKAISNVLDTIEQIYANNRLHFHVEKEYVHRVLMSIVSPVDLKINYDVKKAEYFTVASSPILKNISTHARHREQIDNFRRNLAFGLGGIREKIMAEKQRQQPLLQNRPQMESILHNMSQTNREAEGLSAYYRGAQKNLFAGPQPSSQYYVNLSQNRFSHPKNPMMYPPSFRQEIFSQKLNLGQKLQEQLSNWVVREVTGGRQITRNDLKVKASQIQQTPGFRPSRAWVKSYFKRYPHIKNLILQCELQINKRNDESGSQQEKNSQNVNNFLNKLEIESRRYQQTESAGNSSIEFSHIKDRKNRRDQKQFHLKRVEQVNETQEGREDEKVVYEDGEEKIIIFKGITNQITESKYTTGRRHRKSYVNGNGYNFKNHSRFKDAYFNDLNKMKKMNSVMIVKAEKEENEEKERQEQKLEKQKEKQKIKTQKSQIPEASNSRSRKRYKQYDQGGSKLKSYLNLMRYETVKSDPVKQ